jgi:hypothetical protein
MKAARQVSEFDQPRISRARFVIDNAPELVESVLQGTSLEAAYEKAWAQRLAACQLVGIEIVDQIEADPALLC